MSTGDALLHGLHGPFYLFLDFAFLLVFDRVLSCCFGFSNPCFFIPWPARPAGLARPAGPAGPAGQLFCFRRFAQPCVFGLGPDHVIYSPWPNHIVEKTWFHVLGHPL